MLQFSQRKYMYNFTFVEVKRFCCLHTFGQIHQRLSVPCNGLFPNTTLVLLTVRKFALHFGHKV